ncbi:MAG: glycosyltransferase family A protein, partial [Candidatus Uhrbacteria bacterium]|nr:glycosyltransferase family A protein [Candidatus Uhrbacteria bacterium]
MISVIIPVYNHAKEALECLQALGEQTERDFEVIMVDDGSTDGLADRVDEISSSFHFVFIRFPKNRGAPAARNEGFRHAKGEYVIFLDADVELERNALKVMKKTLDHHPEAAFVYSS